MSDIEWKKKSDALWKHMDYRLYESTHCVNEYIEASFGGIFARLAWGQKHHPPSCFKRSKTKGLLYPDTMTIYPLGYLHDLLRVPSDSYFYTDKWSEDRGFDVLAHLLSHMNKSPEDNPTLLQWLCSISREYPYHSRGDIWGDFLYNERQLIPIPSEPRGGLSLRLANKIYENEDSDDQVEDAAVFSNTRHTGFELYQSMIYRQRAWMFCDSARLYPPIDVHFPAKTILRRCKDEADMYAHEERGRRRSVEW
ncbi:hypothetical protein NW768_002634 [Fusarium equiseti]|uniref:Uncharacterized protein n=1 Tax=Fusarium equiseti TaxID=61235 RepID=A0ABQ8RPU0_FUSEQ|nr:hypothetical protein NW768_002634 [Fusarium equiseti]